MSAFGPSGAPIRVASSAASNNATVVKSSYGGLHVVTGFNTTAIVKYLKFYNKATTPAPATDTPWLTIALPPSTGFALNFNGLKFPLGIGFAIVTGSGDTDNTSVGAADIVGLNVCFE